MTTGITIFIIVCVCTTLIITYTLINSIKSVLDSRERLNTAKIMQIITMNNDMIANYFTAYINDLIMGEVKNLVNDTSALKSIIMTSKTTNSEFVVNMICTIYTRVYDLMNKDAKEFIKKKYTDHEYYLKSLIGCILSDAVDDKFLELREIEDRKRQMENTNSFFNRMVNITNPQDETDEDYDDSDE